MVVRQGLKHFLELGARVGTVPGPCRQRELHGVGGAILGKGEVGDGGQRAGLVHQGAPVEILQALHFLLRLMERCGDEGVHAFESVGVGEAPLARLVEQQARKQGLVLE